MSETTVQQKYDNYRASMKKACAKYYAKTCKIHDDMTPEQRAKAEAIIKKRRETSQIKRNKEKQQLADLLAQLT